MHVTSIVKNLVKNSFVERNMRVPNSLDVSSRISKNIDGRKSRKKFSTERLAS